MRRQQMPNRPTIACFILGMLAIQLAHGTEYDSLISEDYLRQQFGFAAGENLKLSQCEQSGQTTCTYVWGKPSDKDAARIKYGVTPGGEKLLVIFVQASKPQDFDRVKSSYSDAQTVAGIGEQALWSDRRQQLSLITKDNLVVHVNIQNGDGDGQADATAVAKHLLSQMGK